MINQPVYRPRVRKPVAYTLCPCGHIAYMHGPLGCEGWLSAIDTRGEAGCCDCPRTDKEVVAAGEGALS